jgi:hypothetical protein
LHNADALNAAAAPIRIAASDALARRIITTDSRIVSAGPSVRWRKRYPTSVHRDAICLAGRRR